MDDRSGGKIESLGRLFVPCTRSMERYNDRSAGWGRFRPSPGRFFSALSFVFVVAMAITAEEHLAGGGAKIVLAQHIPGHEASIAFLGPRRQN